MLVVGDSSDDIPMVKEGDMFVLKKIQAEDGENGQLSVTEASNVADFVISGNILTESILLI